MSSVRESNDDLHVSDERRESLLVVMRSGVAGLLLLALGCSRPIGVEPAARGDIPPADRPYVVVLGTAQDAGLPQIGCREPLCEAARRDPARRRFASSLLLADPRDGRRWLFEATPDIREQVELAFGHPPNRAPEGPRPPLFDGVFLTHAHVGHYAGLIHFGREAYGTDAQPVYAGDRMREFLTAHAPWSQLVSLGQIVLRPIGPGTPVTLRGDLVVEAVRVPHRDEFSDTFAFRIRGPRRAVLFLPDIDKWETLRTPIETLIASVDVAFIDGTFAEDGEVPGRAMAEIPHPFITESLARFAALPASERAKISFIHLNHTNPASDPESGIARRIRAAGMSVAREGDIFGL
jgi:pyrroloquinoline quinone biosynthesis protein B